MGYAQKKHTSVFVWTSKYNLGAGTPYATKIIKKCDSPLIVRCLMEM